MEDLKELLRPLAFPASAAAVFFGVAFAFFSMANQVLLPPSPDQLHVWNVQIDHSERTKQRFDLRGRPGYQQVQVTLLSSDDFEGVTFRLIGAALSTSVPVPATLELHMSKDPEAAARRHREFPNVTTQIDVYGVRYRDEVLADPAPYYQRLALRHWRNTMLGQGALLLSLVPIVVLVRRAKRIWQEI